MPEAKPTELMRVGLPKNGMTIGRLNQILELAGAENIDTVRHYNGNIIIERPAT